MGSNDFSDVLRAPDLRTRTLGDDGMYPNNENLPVLVYQQMVRRSVHSVAGAVEQVFRSNGWTGAWRNGIFSYHHCHSTAHEVLAVTGTNHVAAGGAVLVLPAGVARKNLDTDRDFQCTVKSLS